MSYQKFDDPSTWGEDKDDFINILFEWFRDNQDGQFTGFYAYLADKRTEMLGVNSNETTKKFEKLYHDYLDDKDLGSQFYEGFYQKVKQEVNKYLRKTSRINRKERRKKWEAI